MSVGSLAMSRIESRCIVFTPSMIEMLFSFVGLGTLRIGIRSNKYTLQPRCVIPILKTTRPSAGTAWSLD